MSQKSLEETKLLWIQVDLLPGLQLLVADEVQQLQALKKEDIPRNPKGNYDS